MLMTWLRYLNPIYALQLERRHKQLSHEHELLKTKASALADSTNALARSTITLVDTAEREVPHTRLEGELTAGLTSMRDALQMIADDLACGRASHAKTLVDALILVIGGPKK